MRRVAYTLLVSVALGATAASSSCSRKEATGGGGSAVDHEIRTLVYTDGFRQRFSLPASGVQPLEAGLEALALRVTRSPYWGSECFLDIYLHSSLDFDYPEGTAGNFFDTSNYGLMFFIGPTSDGDSKFRANRWHKPRWLYRTVDYSEQNRRGVMESGGITGYDRALFPNLSVVTTLMDPNTLEPDQAPAHLWLLRAGQDARAFNRTVPDRDEVHVFTVPKPLLDHAAEATRHAAKFPALPDSKGNFPEPKFSVPPHTSRPH